MAQRPDTTTNPNPSGTFSKVSDIVEGLKEFPLLQPNKYDVVILWPSGNGAENWSGSGSNKLSGFISYIFYFIKASL